MFDCFEVTGMICHYTVRDVWSWACLRKDCPHVYTDAISYPTELAAMDAAQRYANEHGLTIRQQFRGKELAA